jgi:hypothetical protein
MTAVVIRDSDCKVVSTSRNLRGVIARLGRIRPERFDIWPASDGTAQLGITWADGSSMITDFASAAICVRFCENRQQGAPINVHKKEPKQ